MDKNWREHSYTTGKNYFSDQQDNEKIIYCFGEHWIMIVSKLIHLLLVTMLFAGVVVAILFAYKYKVTGYEYFKWLFLALLPVYGYYFHSWIAAIFDCIMKIFIVTDKRIVMIDKGIFYKDNKDIIDLKKIQDIASHKLGLLKNLLGYGDIEITLAATSQTKFIRFVHEPNKIVEIIDRAKRINIAENTDSRNEEA